jgi:type II secretory ATPase GspE/PulE/Tfp pilus assembly ATPase PilB-like protein
LPKDWYCGEGKALPFDCDDLLSGNFNNTSLLPKNQPSTVAANDDYILEILQENALVSGSQVEHAINQRQGAESTVDTLIREGIVTQEDVYRAIASNAAMDFVNLEDIQIGEETAKLIDAEVARRYRVVPLGINDIGGVVVAVDNPLNFNSLDAIQAVLQREVEFVCTTPDALNTALVKLYGNALDAVERMEAAMGKILIGDNEVDVSTGSAEGDTGEAPIIKLATMMLLEAYNMRASDIHIEPMEKVLRVRFRIDGVLVETQQPPKKLAAAIVSRLKIMTNTMSIAEKRLPQDGRIQVKMGKKQLDLRVNIIPTTHGESVVMRILDKSALSLGLPQLGFLSDDQELFENLITLPDGILLVTGPTGSGKTTTLYACLNTINKPDKKLITVEDPVEYQMPGINQVQVNADVGMSFPAALRAMLRQAPNIIMIGEIRDAETANIAINAALTGHLVFSTLHTNDAPSAVARLVDIGVQPFLVSSAVRAMVAQRLVRKICPNCKQPYELTDPEVSGLGLDRSQLSEATVLHGAGCEMCKGRGYKGRAGIFEIFRVDDEVRHMINNKSTTVELRKRAREMGMRTLREDGIRKVLTGMTTAEEVISATMSDAE